MFNEMVNFNLTLEILEGCEYTCSNCAVDREYVPLTISEQDTADLLFMVDDLKEAGLTAFEFVVGPTDIVSADNGVATLEHPLIKGLGERFGSMVAGLSLLSDKGIVDLCGRIDKVIPGKKFRLTVPSTVKNMMNPKYIDMIRRRIGIIKDSLKDAYLYRVYVAINNIDEDIDNFSSEAHVYIANLDIGAHLDADYALPHSRKGLDNIMMVEKLKRDIARYMEIVQSQKGTKHALYLVPDVHDGIELLYRDGVLYYVPILLERFPIFNEKFIIPKPWTAERIIAFKEGLYMDNLISGADHPTCGDCCFLDNCSRGDPRTIMRYLKYDDCILSMKNRWDLVSTMENGKPPLTHLHPDIIEAIANES